MTRRVEPSRILIVLPSPLVGGTEGHTLSVARAWRRAGCAVTVAADPAIAEALGRLAPEVPLVEAPLAYDSGLMGEVMQQRQRDALRPLLIRERPDAALVPLPIPNAAFGALRALAELGVPTLAHAHLVRRDWSLGEADRRALAAVAGKLGFSAVSEPASRRLEGLFGLPFGACAAVPNGLADTEPTRADRPALRARLGLPPDTRIALMVGRLDERKGAHLAPEIAARIAPAVLVLLGDGPLAGSLAAPNLVLAGRVPDPRAWMAAADALILPALHEGAPLVVLEALAEGCPVIATPDALEAWPDAPEVALLAPRDPTAIAAAFARLPDAARVARARAAVTAWDEAAMAERLLRLLAREALRCAA